MEQFDSLFVVHLKNAATGKIRQVEKFASNAQDAIKLALASLRETYAVERLGG